MSAAFLDAYRGVPVLVLGAAGFVGRWVARGLTRCGADLHLGVREPGSLEPLRGPYAIAGRVWPSDLREPGAARALVLALRPAVVFNLAGYGVDPAERDEGLSDRLNRALPDELADAVARLAATGWKGRGLVHAGSALEYGPVDGPVCESLASRPDTTYGRSKLAGVQAIETVAREGRLRAVEGRIFTAYGPGELSTRLLPSLLRARSAEVAIDLTEGSQQRDFVYVGDVAEALLRLGLAEEPGFESVHVATGRLHSVKEFVTTAAEVLDLAPARLRFGALPHRPEEMWHGPVSVERLRRRVGWTPPTTLREGIVATLRGVEEGMP